MDIDIPFFKFNEKINFWLVRADGGKYFDDFINNNYVGIKYNLITIQDLKKLKAPVTLDDLKQLMFQKYKSQKDNSLRDLKSVSKTQLTMHAHQAYNFVYEMKVGDIVITPAKKSQEFALGVVLDNAYDEKIHIINKRNEESSRKDVLYKTSSYVKRRNIFWLFIINRANLPKELSWIMNAHQAVAKLIISDKSKLFNLVSPVYEYNNKFYLRIHTGHGADIDIKEWSNLLSEIPKKKGSKIVLRANVNSPGYFTFLTLSLKNLKEIVGVLFGGAMGSSIVLHNIGKLLFGKENMKKMGLIGSSQDALRKHFDNKLHNLKSKKEIEQLNEKIQSKTKLGKELDLSIQPPGKKIELKNKVIPLELNEKDKDN